MTRQTKRFIELGDILGLRFECSSKECRANLWLPLVSEINRGHPLKKCPSCGQPWMQFGDASQESLVSDLDKAIKALSGASLGCAITVEVSDKEVESK
jgi:hypothetical protein